MASVTLFMHRTICVFSQGLFLIPWFLLTCLPLKATEIIKTGKAHTSLLGNHRIKKMSKEALNQNSFLDKSNLPTQIKKCVLTANGPAFRNLFFKMLG